MDVLGHLSDMARNMSPKKFQKKFFVTSSIRYGYSNPSLRRQVDQCLLCPTMSPVCQAAEILHEFLYLCSSYAG